jgi:hypothetical protein
LDWAKANPVQHTDILGTLEIASHELPDDAKVSTELIIMSDFLEDESELNFVTNRSMISTLTARALAKREAAKHELDIQGATVHLTRLHSRESSSLPSSRMDAVDVFWY